MSIAVLISFFTSPIGRYALIGAAFLAWTVWQREQAATKAREQCQAETIQRTLEETQRQKEGVEAALEAAKAKAIETDKELAAKDDENARIRREIPKAVAAGPCRIPTRTLDRLRGL